MGTRVDAWLERYAVYHRHPGNRATHAVGIPLIIYALMVALALVPLPSLPGWCTMLVPVLLIAVAGYVRVDRPLGLAVSAALVVIALLAMASVRGTGTAGGLVVAGGAFVLGWVFQLVGHWIEGRRPALVDNLLQVFVAPLFLAAEAAAALGLRPYPGSTRATRAGS